MTEQKALKVPPQNLEAERSVIGASLIDPNAVTKVLEFLTPDDFYREKHKIIFQALVSLYQKSEPADLVTLTNELRSRGELDSAGGDLWVLPGRREKVCYALQELAKGQSRLGRELGDAVKAGQLLDPLAQGRLGALFGARSRRPFLLLAPDAALGLVATPHDRIHLSSPAMPGLAADKSTLGGAVSQVSLPAALRAPPYAQRR